MLVFSVADKHFCIRCNLTYQRIMKERIVVEYSEVGKIAGLAATDLPDLNATIIVYCRSGMRSSAAASTLVGLGYTHILDLGGLSNWPYDVVTD